MPLVGHAVIAGHRRKRRLGRHHIVEGFRHIIWQRVFYRRRLASRLHGVIHRHILGDVQRYHRAGFHLYGLPDLLGTQLLGGFMAIAARRVLLVHHDNLAGNVAEFLSIGRALDGGLRLALRDRRLGQGSLLIDNAAAALSSEETLGIDPRIFRNYRGHRQSRRQCHRRHGTPDASQRRTVDARHVAPLSHKNPALPQLRGQD